jgi:FtsP/CotA-like multicopper oxidase with cupredoxin domain
VMALVVASAACGAASGHEHAAVARASKGRTRTYYIAADVVDWDYAPSGRDLVADEDLGDDDAPAASGASDEKTGRIWFRKSLYRQYTDATFTTLVPRSARWRHLGFLGPLIRAEVGDTIVVHFRNNTPFPASMHPHGVFYAKNSEGAPYADGTVGADKADDAISTGGTHTYRWGVPERAGPGPHDGSSVLWMYHAHVNEVADVYAGLVGPIVVTARGKARPDGSPKDVDREFVTMFEVSDENQSPWLDENVRNAALDPTPALLGDPTFVEGNLVHGINGYVRGNLPGLTMKKGQRVRWYVMSMGNEVDLHTPHWHGNTVEIGGMRTDTTSLLPGSMVVADMVPDDVGTWLFHCHVSDHLLAGMQALYTVTK